MVSKSYKKEWEGGEGGGELELAGSKNYCIAE